MFKFEQKFESHIKKLSLINKSSLELYLSDNPILIRYWDKGSNWGDFINPYIFEGVLQKPVLSTYRIYNFLKKEIVLGIGSIISGDLSNTVIWGSGFISDKAFYQRPPKKVLAVRGRLTGERLKNMGVKLPDLYGDPALLYPTLFNHFSTKKYKVGFIPHYAHKTLDFVKKLRVIHGDDLKIIDIEGDHETFAKDIISCESIFSSSLHGLILAESYGIPTCRVIVDKYELTGGDFKFYDYYSGVGIRSFDNIDTVKLIDAKSNLPKFASIKDLSFNADLLKESLITHISNRKEYNK